MRRILLILIPVILILALLFTLRNCAPALIERDSDDGLLHLSIPTAALPAGTDANSIRIVTLDAAKVAPVPGVLRPLFAYRLEPEGLSFSQPVQLTVDAGNWGPRQLPVLLHRSGTALEALELDVTVVNERVESITTELLHFSEVLGTLSILAVDIDDPADQHMQSPFYVRTSVATRPAELDKLNGDPNGIWSRQRVQGPVNLSAGTFSTTGTLTPNNLGGKPVSEDMALTAGHNEFEMFECTAESAGNQISYTLQTAFKLLLSDNSNPNRIVEVPIKDKLTVRSNAFACLAPQPPPSVDHFETAREFIDSRAEDYFEIDISKTPGGAISVGKDFTLKAEVTHVYDGAGATAIGPSWELRYGLFEYGWIINDAISPSRVADLPWLAMIDAENSWEGEARFRCMNAGSAVINYKAFVYAKSPNANVNGVLAFPVKGEATVECIADADALTPSTFTALSGSDRTGVVSGQAFDSLNGFQVRWWREPAANDIYIGTAVKAHVEVENLRSPAAGSPGVWALSGRLYSMAGNGLEPQEYPQAPPPGVSLPFRGVWSADYTFTCRRPEVTFLRHSLTLLPPGSPTDPPLQLSIDDPGLKCIGD